MILEKFNLKGKSGIVTGGGSGIGKGIAKGLVQAGAEVIISGRDMDKLQRTEEELGRGGGRIVGMLTDGPHRRQEETGAWGRRP